MDYAKGMLRLHKKGALGMEVYNISMAPGIITIENGLMGQKTHRQSVPLAEKPRVDRLVQRLLEQGFAPFEKTFGPWSDARAANIQRDVVAAARLSKTDKLRRKWGEFH